MNPSFVKDESNLLSYVKEKFTQSHKKKIRDAGFNLKSNSFYPSTITQCPRRIMLRILDKDSVANEICEDNMRCVELKQALVEKWKNYFKLCPQLDIVNGDGIISDCNINLYSRMDFVFKAINTFVLVNVQPVSKVDFIAVKKGGALRSHVVEITLQMWMAELYNGIIIYDKGSNLVDDNDYLLFHIKPYERIIRSIQKKCQIMMNGLSKGKLIDRPYGNEGLECGSCEFNKKCWGK